MSDKEMDPCYASISVSPFQIDASISVPPY